MQHWWFYCSLDFYIGIRSFVLYSCQGNKTCSFKPTHIHYHGHLLQWCLLHSYNMSYSLLMKWWQKYSICHQHGWHLTHYCPNPSSLSTLMALLLRASWQNVLSPINLQMFQEENSGGIKPESCHWAGWQWKHVVLFVLHLSSCGVVA